MPISQGAVLAPIHAAQVRRQQVPIPDVAFKHTPPGKRPFKVLPFKNHTTGGTVHMLGRALANGFRTGLGIALSPTTARLGSSRLSLLRAARLRNRHSSIHVRTSANRHVPAATKRILQSHYRLSHVHQEQQNRTQGSGKATLASGTGCGGLHGLVSLEYVYRHKR